MDSIAEIERRKRIAQEDAEDAPYRKHITTGTITMAEYAGTNLNIERMCGGIYVVGSTELYDVMVSTSRKDRRFYIYKDGFKCYLDDEVKKAFNIEMNIYNRDGI